MEQCARTGIRHLDLGKRPICSGTVSFYGKVSEEGFIEVSMYYGVRGLK